MTTIVIYSHRHRIRTFESDDTDAICHFVEGLDDSLFLAYVTGSSCEYFGESVYIMDMKNILSMLKFGIYKMVDICQD